MEEPQIPIEELQAQADAVELAVQQSVREALRAHKRAGNPVVQWRNGQIEWIPPEDIQVADD